jgi:lysozyme
MNAIQIATALIHKWEGCKLRAYPDPATGGAPWTIGYGATGPSITEGIVWTQAQADNDLSSRLNLLHGEITPECPSDATDNQIGACIDFAYNEGVKAFLGSTLLRDWNAGNLAGADAEFPKWDMAQGHEVDGLENRREDELRVFMGGEPT